MNNKPALTEIENLWQHAQAMETELRSAIVEINEMWAEISGIAHQVLDEPTAPAELRAEYLVAETMHVQYMQRASPLLVLPQEILERLRRVDPLRKLETFHASTRNLDAAQLLTMPLESLQILKSDDETVEQYYGKSLLASSSALIVAYSPMFYIRDAFSAYLDKPRPSEAIFEIMKEVGENVAIDLLGKVIPFLNVAVAVAKAMRNQSEKRYPIVSAMIKERSLFLHLQASVDQGMVMLAEVEKFLATYRSFADKIDDEFLLAATRRAEVILNLGTRK